MPPKELDLSDTTVTPIPLRSNRAILELLAQLILPDGKMLAFYFDPGEYDSAKIETTENRLYILAYRNGEVAAEFTMERDGQNVAINIRDITTAPRAFYTIARG